MRRRTISCIAIAAAVVALGACNDGSNKPDAKETQDVEARLLKVVDLPATYATVRTDPKDAKKSTNVGCETQDETRDRIATADAAYQSAKGDRVEETVSKYERGGAHRVIAAAAQLPQRCGTVTNTQSGLTSETTYLTADFPTLGDESTAVRVTGRVGTTKINFFEVFIRKGERLAVLVHGGLIPPDKAVTEDLARRAVAKL
jgi:hypothetical protein